MAKATILNPNPPQFEPFLYASVGEDSEGSTVTVLSALARLNLDPWAEAAELAEQMARRERRQEPVRRGGLVGRRERQDRRQDRDRDDDGEHDEADACEAVAQEEPQEGTALRLLRRGGGGGAHVFTRGSTRLWSTSTKRLIST